jgi:hypothetical protein
MGVGMGQYEKPKGASQAKPSQAKPILAADSFIPSFLPSFLSSIKMLLLSCRMICTQEQLMMMDLSCFLYST